MFLARQPLRCVNVFEGIKMCGYGDESRQLVGVDTSLLVMQDTIKSSAKFDADIEFGRRKIAS